MMIEGLRAENDQQPAACGLAVNRSPRSTGEIHGGKLKHLLTSPAAALAVALTLAVAVMLVPRRWNAVMKGHVAAVLRPGQVALLSVRDEGSRIVAGARSHFGTAAQLAEAERERKRLAEENRRLAAELAVARSRQPSLVQDSHHDSLDRLLKARCVNARVLGELARAFLGRHRLLDVGSQVGIQPDAPVVLAPPEIIDQGRDAGLKAGQLVLTGCRVWGKVVQVGPATSVVRTVTEPGYRDLVRLGDSGPQGILEGTGRPLARIRLIEVTEPVAVGDPVYSTAGKGFLPEPLLYGQIVRVERPVGATHWEIWLEPAADPDPVDQVAVLRIEFNPVRLAKQRGVRSGEW